MRVLSLNLVAAVQSTTETAGRLKDPGDTVLVERGRPRVLVMRCPSGCGEDITLNLDPKAGPAWRIYRRDGKVTLFPSVWRDTGCESHFIVSMNRIYLFGGARDEDESDSSDWRSPWSLGLSLDQDAVLAALVPGRLMTVEELADLLGEFPWDVHRACRKLVAAGLLQEGKGRHRGEFMLK